MTSKMTKAGSTASASYFTDSLYNQNHRRERLVDHINSGLIFSRSIELISAGDINDFRL